MSSGCTGLSNYRSWCECIFTVHVYLVLGALVSALCCSSLYDGSNRCAP